ncbi:hypothetical protein FRC04_009379 [Tulasnella sp. 424]|nr:hypothetical protein FRC04_009379 [Tulasnella sp. 424]
MELTRPTVTGRLLSTLGLPPPLVAKLKQAGYETTSDVASTPEGELTKELGVDQLLPAALLACLPGQSRPRSFLVPQDPSLKSIPASQILSQSLASSRRPINSAFTRPNSTPASALLAKPRTYQTPCLALNSLLSFGIPTSKPETATLMPPSEGGLRSLYILEICGPPGSGKASLALEFVRSAVRRQEAVLIADCQSTMTPGRINDALSKDSDSDDENHPSKLVLRTHLPTLPHLMAFIRKLPQYLDQKKIKLIVFSTLSFLFQPTEYFTLSFSEKTRILDTVKQSLTRACLENGVTIIITSQTATKLVRPDAWLMLSRDPLGVRHAQLIASPAMTSSLNSKTGTQGPPSRPLPSADSGAKRAAFMIDNEGRAQDIQLLIRYEPGAVFLLITFLQI